MAVRAELRIMATSSKKTKTPAPAKVAKRTGVAAKAAKRKAPAKKPTAARKSVKLLSGGNPQIAKGGGNAPVQAYIAAVPGWKREVCKKLDAIITRNVPDVLKAVKWNSPFYGVPNQGWFLSFHVFNSYVKVAFFK